MIIDKSEFEKILKKNQSELKEHLEKELDRIGYKNPIREDGYIYVKGKLPCLLVAHIDRHTNLPEKLETINKGFDEHGNEKWSSPDGIAGDDRCGVYIILELIKKYNTSVLFTEDEEIGCKGSGKFIESKYLEDLKKLNYFIQIDRGQLDKTTEKFRKDVVFYNTSNDEFKRKILELTGYDCGEGTSTDIRHLTEETKVASFNIGCGYFNEHTTDEYIILDEMVDCYNAVENVINNLKGKYSKD